MAEHEFVQLELHVVFQGIISNLALFWHFDVFFFYNFFANRRTLKPL